ncbi:MAG: flagellar biosynthesis protein FlhA [Planctomycetota bacterium]
MRWAEGLGRHRDVALVLSVLAILGTIFVPLPPFVLDALLTVSLTAALLILVTVLHLRDPLEFSAFPAVLLLTTAFRLALNVATTRQILANAGQEGTRAAGRMVEAFGTFVAAGEPVIGFVIFGILVLVNFVVITKGAGRISEVAARFTLDALPGKQMAVDADLNAGLIDEAEARRRRERIAREADFHGAMDGASKFVRGDAVAGLVITLLNIGAGFAVGCLKHGMSAGEALSTYTILTIGDGLVTQVPALVVSLAAGLMVSRSAAREDLGRAVFGQVFAERRALWTGAGFLGALAATGLVFGSGLPVVPMAAGTALLVWGARAMARAQEAARAREEAARTQAASPPEKVQDLLRVEPVELELGYGLVRLAEPAQGGDLLDRIARLRRQMAVELGLVVPPVRVRDNGQRPVLGYAIRIQGTIVAEGTLRVDRLLAMDAGGASGPLEGEKTREPAFGLSAYWISPPDRGRAEAMGYTVAEPAAVLATHLGEVLRRHAHELLTRDEVQNLLKALKETRPAVVEEVVPGLLKPGEVQKVLQNLLREGVSIRDLGTILEVLGDHAPRSRDPEELTERVRQALARAICGKHLEKDGRMYVITLDSRVEDLIRSATERTERGGEVGLAPALAARLADRIRREAERLEAAGHAPVILCSPAVRPQVRRIAESVRPGMAVLSYREIVREVRVEALGMVTADA